VVEMYIGGQRVSSPGSERLEVRDPATGDLVDTVPAGDAEVVDRAVQEASKAFAAWSETPGSERGDHLYAAERVIREHVEELAALLTSEQGKPLLQSRLELHRAAETLKHFAGLGKNLRGGYVPALDEETHGLVVKRPVGVVGAIVPWNFPTTLLCNKLGPALVAGNTVVAKPAETTPLTTLRMAELLHEEAGLPPGVFNVVTGTGVDAGEALVTHPLVRKVAFTGSTATGKRIAALASEGLKRVTLELGGSDPFIIADDADVDAAVSAASMGRFFNCGQACLAVKRLYVFAQVADEVAEKLVVKAEKLRVGHGSDDGVHMGPLHSERQRDLLAAQVRDSVDSGGQLLTGGGPPEGDHFAHGWFYEPTLVLEPAHDSRMATEEVFGPALPIWSVSGLDEAIELANRSPWGLGSSIWTRDIDSANYAAERLEAGYTWVNAPQRVYDELPFGGWKESGVGKEHGIEALDHYFEEKSVVIRRRRR
jgi:acyl-CoA reductase-like NAD-dependent aldehyde dehydrogenase